MSQVVLEHYRGLMAKQGENAEACFSKEESKSEFFQCHNFLNDIVELRKSVLDRPEAYCLNYAEIEYQFALLALINGHYRQSFGSLRLTFELMLSAIYFSGHEVKLRQWLEAHRDLSWGGLADDDKGIFSAGFVRAFSPELVDRRKQYLALATTAYRECSEFVHGNPKVSETLATKLTFQAPLLTRWRTMMQSMRTVVLFCHLFRYYALMSPEAKESLRPIYLEEFGHEADIRAILEE